MHHVISVEHAELFLARTQTGNLLANRGGGTAILGPEHEQIRVLQRAHALHPQIPAK